MTLHKGSILFKAPTATKSYCTKTKPWASPDSEADSEPHAAVLDLFLLLEIKDADIQEDANKKDKVHYQAEKGRLDKHARI